MKILLFGGSGQLGREILKRASDLHFEIVYPNSREVDVTHEATVKKFIETIKPDVLINSSAYTAVDKAEEEREKAFALNAEAPLYIAKACKAHSVRCLHISTDYVFSGELGVPLTESDETGPINVYGESKLAGENAISSEIPDNSLIIRTASLHGRLGNNIVHTLLKLFESQTALKFIFDQIMSPTWAGFLAETILDLIRIEAKGLVHVAGSGQCSWYEFASTVYDYAKELGLCDKQVEILPVKASEFTTKAKRPAFSALDTSYLEKLLGRKAIDWQIGLKNHLTEILNEGFA